MTQPQDAALELSGVTIPSARSISAQLKANLNAAVLAERQRRGEVHLPEDTWPMHQALARVVETCGEYARAFDTAAKEARQIAEEELIDIVGESDGRPNQGMTIPDPDGDVVISLDMPRVHEFDTDALYTAVASDVLESLEIHRNLIELLGDTFDTGMMEPDEVTEFHESLDNFLAGMLVMALGRLTECGKFEPQVTKVKRFTDEMARNGGAQVAATVTSSHRVRPIYKGVKVERKPTKPGGRK